MVDIEKSLMKMEMNVAVGGWRQWFELGIQDEAKEILRVCAEKEQKSPKIKALEEMLKFFSKIGLLDKSSHTETPCICARCEGFGSVEDGMEDVTCEMCDGTGETWSGRLSKHSKSLEALTEKYLSIKEEERRQIFAELTDGKKLSD